tara:strand:- start:6090 stop:6350 length:261 start_codon:yes stop_codon:yes gene_type:complete
MKTLIIYPNEGYNTGFTILDPETGEGLASHFCSHQGFAKYDLHDGRPERLEEWKETFGDDTEAKFIGETDYNWEEIYKKNQELGKK